MIVLKRLFKTLIVCILRNGMSAIYHSLILVLTPSTLVLHLAVSRTSYFQLKYFKLSTPVLYFLHSCTSFSLFKYFNRYTPLPHFLSLFVLFSLYFCSFALTYVYYLHH